ncbi:MAG: D-tyrosyl-tRNA(Tyr) deacylase [Clostridiales bacterium]|nr:D-tyrosyl-tRNA(Tyr) deacylase [Clostridiales bacterium]
MIAVLQRVKQASVTVGEECIGEIGQGLLILLGVKAGDTAQDVDVLCAKIAKLRIFEDEAGKMNRSVSDIGGACLVISNFTLLADYRHGNRPDFLNAEKPAAAKALYQSFAERLSLLLDGRVQCGEFGADMQVALVNDGPVTIVMDSENLKK